MGKRGCPFFSLPEEPAEQATAEELCRDGAHVKLAHVHVAGGGHARQALQVELGHVDLAEVELAQVNAGEVEPEVCRQGECLLHHLGEVKAARRSGHSRYGVAWVGYELLGHLGRGLHGLHELLGNLMAGHWRRPSRYSAEAAEALLASSR